MQIYSSLEEQQQATERKASGQCGCGGCGCGAGSELAAAAPVSAPDAEAVPREARDEPAQGR